MDEDQLSQSEEESFLRLSKNFQKIKYKLFPKFEHYIAAHVSYFEKCTFEKRELVTRAGNEFKFFHLISKSHPKQKHVENVFQYPKLNINKLGQDLMYCNTLLSFVLFNNILLIKQAMATDMKDYQLIPIRWTNVYETGDHKVLFLKIPKGEFGHFEHKARHEERFSSNWVRQLLREPLVFYKLGNRTFNVSKDGKTLSEGGTEMPVIEKKKKDHPCLQSFVVWHFIKTALQSLPEDQIQYWSTSVDGGSDEQFWYFKDRSSNGWATTSV